MQQSVESTYRTLQYVMFPTFSSGFLSESAEFLSHLYYCVYVPTPTFSPSFHLSVSIVS